MLSTECIVDMSYDLITFKPQSQYMTSISMQFQWCPVVIDYSFNASVYDENIYFTEKCKNKSNIMAIEFTSASPRCFYHASPNMHSDQ